MKNLVSILFLILFGSIVSYAQKSDSIEKSEMAYLENLQNFQKNIPFQSGKVNLSERVELNIPLGYKFIPKKESEKIIFELWNNPKSDNILGMLVLNNFQLINPNDWSFVITEENEGYVKDDDASKIDYDELLKEIKGSEDELNEQRKKEGFPQITTVGWASRPYYDSSTKILHWAKELNFEGNNGGENTLNYDVRILGREGLLSLNAVGPISALENVKKHIPEIINIAKFKEGHKYFDFDPNVDKIAAYSIGGLVAGKLLAKAGLIAILLKNIKLVILALGGGFTLFKNKIFRFFGRKEKIESESLTNNENNSEAENL